jgi:hypothetical protein
MALVYHGTGVSWHWCIMALVYSHHVSEYAAVVMMSIGDMAQACGRLKLRLNGLRPRSPPPRTHQTLSHLSRRLRGDLLQPAQAGFVAERSEAAQARF